MKLLLALLCLSLTSFASSLFLFAIDAAWPLVAGAVGRVSAILGVW